MPSVSPRDLHTRRLLDEVSAGTGVSQRSLAKSAGIALGLTNLLLKRLVHKGWVRVIHIKRNRVRYLITPAGIAEKARMSRAYFAYTTRFYAETRDRIREQFALVAANWPDANSSADKRVIFYGAGEVAEIGYVCLLGTDLQLAGVVDEAPSGSCCGMTVRPIDSLAAAEAALGAACVVVMSFTDAEAIAARLEALGWPSERVFFT